MKDCEMPSEHIHVATEAGASGPLPLGEAPAPLPPATGSQIYVLCTTYCGPVEWTASRDEAAAWEDRLKGVRYVVKVDPLSCAQST